MAKTGLDPATAELLHAAIHDLKGPASRIRLGAQLLSRNNSGLDEDSRMLLRHIEDSASALDVVAHGLRDYVDICSRPIDREPVAVAQLADAAKQTLFNEIAQSGAEVTHATRRVLDADRFLMGWVMQELLTNAIRFRGDSAPRVHIADGLGGPGGWYVSIVDNGRGIEPRLAKRVFQPFKKLSAGGSGAGLGLAICRQVIQSHGGEIWLEAREQGADFRFFLGMEE
ncbi:MAG TPA: ATP-binding protein [Bryobacteraceae bacterium]|nr:ATP-binding protein [Bryobacteraceae bacterium]